MIWVNPMQDYNPYQGTFIICDELKEKTSKMSEFQIHMIAERIAISIRDTEEKLKEEFEKKSINET